MRTTTLTRGFRVALILAGLLVLPQFAFAQLSAIETRVLKLQGATSGAVSLDAQAAVTNYTLRFPAAQASAAGAFLYVANTTTGELAFTNTTGLTQGARHLFGIQRPRPSSGKTLLVPLTRTGRAPVTPSQAQAHWVLHPIRASTSSRTIKHELVSLLMVPSRSTQQQTVVQPRRSVVLQDTQPRSTVQRISPE